MNKRALGNLGESAAEKYLLEKGYRILTRNYGRYTGEIDLIASIDDILVFIEVKSRSNSSYGHGLEAVDYRKQEKIRNTSLLYLVDKGFSNMQIRYDVIEFNLKSSKIEHIENAF